MMMSPWWSLAALFSQMYCVVVVVNGSSDVDATVVSVIQRRYDLYHDFGHGFVERDSRITLTANADTLSAQIENVCPSSSSSSSQENNDDNMNTCSNNNNNSNHHDAALKETDVLALMKAGGFYKLKAVDTKTGSVAMTSVSPCEIKKANYRENLKIVLSSRADLISLEYAPLVSPLRAKTSCLLFLDDAEKKEQDLPVLPIQFNTTVSYSSSTPAVTLPLKLSSPMTIPRGGFKMLPRDKNSDTSGHSDLNGGNNNNNNNDGGAFHDETVTNSLSQSFMVKYWYIILPIFMIVVLGTEETPSPSSVESAATVTAGTATAAAAATAGAQKVRRGKRG